MGILNLWILLRKIVGRKSLKKLSDENVIFMDIFAVKVDGNDVNPGICKEVFIYTDSWVDVILTSLRQIYQQKSPWRWHFRPTRYTIFLRRIQRLQIFKIPVDVICTLNFEFSACFGYISLFTIYTHRDDVPASALAQWTQKVRISPSPTLLNC